MKRRQFTVLQALDGGWGFEVVEVLGERLGDIVSKCTTLEAANAALRLLLL